MGGSNCISSQEVLILRFLEIIKAHYIDNTLKQSEGNQHDKKTSNLCDPKVSVGIWIL